MLTGCLFAGHVHAMNALGIERTQDLQTLRGLPIAELFADTDDSALRCGGRKRCTRIKEALHSALNPEDPLKDEM